MFFQKLSNLRQSRKYAREEKTWKRQLYQWFATLGNQGTFIHPSIDFVIKPDFSRIKIASNCFIDRDCSIWLSQDTGADAKLEIQQKVYIARGTYIGVFQPITIGKFVIIGAYSYIISANHCYTRRDIPIQDQGYVGSPIVIEDDVWIGTHVVVLPGVTIGKGAIIAAGSIVNKSIPPYEIWGGTPAKFLKTRP